MGDGSDPAGVAGDAETARAKCPAPFIIPAYHAVVVTTSAYFAARVLPAVTGAFCRPSVRPLVN
jgi:hypothetical protein